MLSHRDASRQYLNTEEEDEEEDVSDECTGWTT